MLRSIFAYSKDTNGYYMPIENFKNGIGYSELSTKSVEGKTIISYVPSASRMPGLLPVYLPLLYFFSSDTAKVLMIFIQLAMGIVAMFLLAKTCEMLFERKFFFIIALLLYSASAFISLYEHFGLSDSLSISTLIFSVYFFVKYLKHQSGKNIFYSGIFLGWSVFIRPVTGPFFPFFILIYFLFEKKEKIFSFGRFMKNSLIFILPFTVAISAWSYRNYNVFGKLILLQMPLEMQINSAFPKERLITMDFISALGENPIQWTDYTMGDWFYGYIPDFDLSDLCYTSVFNADSIVHLKKYYLETLNNNITDEERNRNKKTVAELSDAYIKSIREEKPFHYYFTAKIKFIRCFIFPEKFTVAFPFPPKNEMNIFQFLFKGGSFIFLYFITIFGFLGIIISLVKRDFLNSLFSIFPLLLIIIIPGIVGYTELRYYTHVYVFMVMFSVVSIVFFIDMFYSRRIKSE